MNQFYLHTAKLTVAIALIQGGYSPAYAASFVLDSAATRQAAASAMANPTSANQTQANGVMNANTNAADSAALNGLAVTTPSSTNSGNTSSSGNNMMSMISLAIGVGMTAYGVHIIMVCEESPPVSSSCEPPGYLMIGMGALSALQALAGSGASGQNADVASQTATGPSGGIATPDSGTGGTSATTPASIAKQADAILAAAQSSLAKSGATLDPKTGTITTADGKVITPADMSSAEGMANATGMSPSDYKNVMAKVAQLEKDATSKLDKYAYSPENGFAGGGSTGSLGSGDPAADAAKAQRALASVAGKDKKLGVAGMVRNYQGEMIGVAGDDIFQMMTRRYQEKTKNQSFLSPESIPTAPAAAAQVKIPYKGH